MEELWSDLCYNQNQIPVPQWHKDLLDRREKLIKEGKATFVDWETAKKRIADVISNPIKGSSCKVVFDWP